MEAYIEPHGSHTGDRQEGAQRKTKDGGVVVVVRAKVQLRVEAASQRGQLNGKHARGA